MTDLLFHPIFIISAVLCLIWVCYDYHGTQSQLHVFLKKTKQYNCVKKLPSTKYENADLCDIDPMTPRSENIYVQAEKSFGHDAYLDAAHYEYFPGESRADYHQRWRERVRMQTIFHPGDANYC